MNEELLKMAIEVVVKSYDPKEYRVWTIGVTGDAQTRRTEHGNPKAWKQWRVDTDTIARNVESHFIKLGMKGGTGGQGMADTLYIF